MRPRCLLDIGGRCPGPCKSRWKLSEDCARTSQVQSKVRSRSEVHSMKCRGYRFSLASASFGQRDVFGVCLRLCENSLIALAKYLLTEGSNEETQEKARKVVRVFAREFRSDHSTPSILLVPTARAFIKAARLQLSAPRYLVRCGFMGAALKSNPSKSAAASIRKPGEE